MSMTLLGMQVLTVSKHFKDIRMTREMLHGIRWKMMNRLSP